MKNYIYPILIFIVFVSFCGIVSTSFANPINLIKNGYKDVFLRNDQGYGASKKLDFEDRTERYIYETPTLETISHTYWALDFHSLSDDEAIDSFMWINECDIYRTYYSDQFEWKDIRNATRDFLKKNKKEFPTRFQFIIPIFLKDYDTRLHAFELQDGYVLNSIRRFEVVAKNSNYECAVSNPGSKKLYPASMLLEFSRPLTLTHIPMTKDRADEYIKEKTSIAQSKGKVNKSASYEFREAFLVIKVNIFAHGETFSKINKDGHNSLQLLSILEGFEVYLDYDRTDLVYSEVFVSKRQSVAKIEEQLNEQYDILREKAAGEGILR